MQQRMRLWFQNNQVWINLTQYVLYSVVLLILVGMIDLRIWPIQNYIPAFMLMPVDVAQNLLTTLAGALLTITTFTFSTILTVLTTYMNNYSPRVVGNFINQKITMQVLGIFLGGFFYCIVSLFLIRETFFQTVEVIAGSVAILYVIICMIYFAVFVVRVIYSLRSVNVVKNVYDDTLPVIESEVKKRRDSFNYTDKDYNYTVKVYAKSSGYLSVINYESILKLIDDIDGDLVIERKYGDYVVQGFHLATLQYDVEPDLSQEKFNHLLGDIAGSFLYQEEKFEEEDYRFNISKLVEIAIRAAGPGVNDPNTAIHCIRKIAILLGKLFSTSKHYITVRDLAETKIIYKTYTIKEELYSTYQQIIYYCKNDPSIMTAMLEGLLTTYMMSSVVARPTINRYYEYVYEVACESAPTELDVTHYKSLHHKFDLVDDDNVNKEIMDDSKENA